MRFSPFSFSSFRGAVKALVLANVAVFVLQWILPGLLERAFGLIPIKIIGGFQIWRLFTYMFLHGGFFHILMNMFVLWMFGKELESSWGTREFLKFYFICGVGAGLFNTLFEPFSPIPIIGASGSIYGILVAFAMVFPDSIIYLYAIIPMKAKHFVILIGVMEFLASFHGSASVIARFAHLGGMATGYFYLKSFGFRSVLNNFFQKLTGFFVVKKAIPKRPKKQSEDDLVKEVDRILEKVLVQGAESLTDKEREVMRRYSSMKH